MATSRISSVKSRSIYRSISRALALAVLEGLLICMLFINAIFSYVITKFACHYELQTPCPLCSSLDHLLGKKRWKFYWDSICWCHKSEISSLVLCHSHNNLVDVHGMCENCLFSFATSNKSNAETYRLLVGKLGEDSGFGLDQDAKTLIEGHNSGTRNCSCCNEPWVPRGCDQKFMQTKSVGSEAADFDVLLSCPKEHQQSTKKNGDGLDPLSHAPIEPSQNDSASATTRDIPTEASEESKSMSLVHVNAPSDTRPSSPDDSQLSAAREQSMPDLSPRVMMSPNLSLNSDEWKTSDASFTIGMRTLQKRISLERNESGLSMDGSSVSEIEGESVVDRLKQQVEHDKKLIAALYKELEEERSASAVATNQAMAMITRLQEEKAALQMEALQCLRMMEEQAEYDMEALDQTNDLLAEREKELQDLEDELEFYREKYPYESMLENMVEPLSALKESNVGRDLSEASQGDTSTSNFRNLPEFEDERSHMSQCLKRLQKTLYLFSNHGIPVDIASSEHPGSKEDTKMKLKELHKELGSELNSVPEVGDFSTQNNQGSEPQGHVSSLEKPETDAKGSIEIFYSGQSSPLYLALGALTNVISDLNDKLKAIEADRTFLELTVNSIRHGEEGFLLDQEIASHLKELRRMSMRRTATC